MPYALEFQVPGDEALNGRVKEAICDEHPAGLLVHTVVKTAEGCDTSRCAGRHRPARRRHRPEPVRDQRQLPRRRPADHVRPWRSRPSRPRRRRRRRLLESARPTHRRRTRLRPQIRPEPVDLADTNEDAELPIGPGLPATEAPPTFGSAVLPAIVDAGRRDYGRGYRTVPWPAIRDRGEFRPRRLARTVRRRGRRNDQHAVLAVTRLHDTSGSGPHEPSLRDVGQAWI